MSFLKFPVKGRSLRDLTSPFGPRNGSFHNGIDIRAAIGTEIIAPGDGIVRTINTTDRGGKQLIIEVGPYIIGFSHLSDYEIGIDDSFNEGQVLAYSGNTGNSTGPHVHLTVREKNAKAGIFLDPAKLDWGGFSKTPGTNQTPSNVFSSWRVDPLVPLSAVLLLLLKDRKKKNDGAPEPQFETNPNGRFR